MRKTLPALLAPLTVLAHTGEAVEEHMWIEIALERMRDTLGPYGLLVTAMLFVGALLFFAYVLWSFSRAR